MSKQKQTNDIGVNPISLCFFLLMAMCLCSCDARAKYGISRGVYVPEEVPTQAVGSAEDWDQISDAIPAYFISGVDRESSYAVHVWKYESGSRYCIIDDSWAFPHYIEKEFYWKTLHKTEYVTVLDNASCWGYPNEKMPCILGENGDVLLDGKTGKEKARILDDNVIRIETEIGPIRFVPTSCAKWYEKWRKIGRDLKGK